MNRRDSVASEKMQKCPACGSTKLTKFDNHRVACMRCGFVTNTKTPDDKPYANLGEPQQEISRAKESIRTLLSKNQNFTTIDDKHYIRVNPRELAALNQRFPHCLVGKWWKNSRVSDQTEKNLALALAEITKTGCKLALPKRVLEEAAKIYKKIVNAQYIKGRSIRELSVATIYMACRKCGVARSLDHIASLSDLSKKRLARDYRFLVKKLGCSIPPTNPTQYQPRLSEQLALSARSRKLVGKILSIAEELKLTAGRKPIGIVAGAIYIASLVIGEKKTQREIADVTGVTEATIRNRYKELAERLLFVLTL